MATLGTALFGPASLLMSVEGAVRDAGYPLRVVSTVEGDPAGVAGAARLLIEQGVHGIVISEPIDEGTVTGRIDVPVVVLAGDDVTPVFAANDDMAIGLIRALLEAGRRVPGDVSVVGFDDIPLAAFVTPPLTTVRQPFDVVAREGVKLLVPAIDKPDADPATAVDPPVELIVRASTAPPPPRKIPER